MFSPSRIYHVVRARKIQTRRQKLLFSLEFLLYSLAYHVSACSLPASPGICRQRGRCKYTRVQAHPRLECTRSYPNISEPRKESSAAQSFISALSENSHRALFKE